MPWSCASAAHAVATWLAVASPCLAVKGLPPSSAQPARAVRARRATRRGTRMAADDPGGLIGLLGQGSSAPEDEAQGARAERRAAGPAGRAAGDLVAGGHRHAEGV